MTDHKPRYDDDLLSSSDAMQIGEKIVEMADRVKATSPAVPRCSAKWTVTIDGEAYEVEVRQAK